MKRSSIPSSDRPLGMTELPEKTCQNNWNPQGNPDITKVLLSSMRHSRFKSAMTIATSSIGVVIVIALGLCARSAAQAPAFVDSEPLFSVDMTEEEFEEEVLNLPDPSQNAEAIYSAPVTNLALRERASSSSYEYVLLDANGWLEFKTDSRIKCVLKNPISDDCAIKTKVPVLYRRTSRLQWVATVYLDSREDYKEAVKDCISGALATGALAGLVTGSLESSAVVLEKYLEICLVAKEISNKLKVDVSIRTRKVPGRWKPV